MMCREFFQVYQPRTSGDQIRSLRDQYGRTRSSPDEVMELATDFYRQLFQQEAVSARVQCCRQQVWDCIPSLVTEEMGRSLLEPFTEQELAEAFHA